MAFFDIQDLDTYEVEIESEDQTKIIEQQIEIIEGHTKIIDEQIELISDQTVFLEPDEIIEEQAECGRIYRNSMGLMCFQCSLCPQEFELLAEFAMHLADEHPMPYLSDKIVEDEIVHLTIENFNDRPAKRCNDEQKVVDTFESQPHGSVKCKLCKKYLPKKDHSNHTKYPPNKPVSERTCSETNCSAVFESKCQLKQHMFRFHSGKYKPFSCHICGKNYCFPLLLKRHIDVHLGKKPYKCDICRRTYPTHASIRHHMLIHAGNKPYQCWQCGERFYSTGRLRMHTYRSHSGAKPFPCKYCDYFTFCRQGIEGHQRSHTGERPFACETCNKTFRLKGQLKRHELIHAKSLEPKQNIKQQNRSVHKLYSESEYIHEN